VGGVQPDVSVGTKSFDLSCKDAKNKDDWRLRIKGQPANPGLPEKWPLKRRVCHFWGTKAILE